MNTSQDTIAAISTPHGEGGIGIIRLSGSSSVDIVKGVFVDVRGERLREVKSHRVTYGFIVDPESGRRIDEVLLTVMLAPRSNTRENRSEEHTSELQSHSFISYAVFCLKKKKKKKKKKDIDMHNKVEY